jgi:hypothetical protein
MLYPQFAHLPVSGAFYSRRVWKGQRGTIFHQKFDNATDTYLFFVG